MYGDTERPGVSFRWAGGRTCACREHERAALSLPQHGRHLQLVWGALLQPADGQRGCCGRDPLDFHLPTCRGQQRGISQLRHIKMLVRGGPTGPIQQSMKRKSVDGDKKLYDILKLMTKLTLSQLSHWHCYASQNLAVQMYTSYHETSSRTLCTPTPPASSSRLA